MRLYEIADQFIKLDDFIPDVESAEDSQAYSDLFDEFQGDLSDKVHGCCCVIRNTESEANALAQEIKRIEYTDAFIRAFQSRAASDNFVTWGEKNAYWQRELNQAMILAEAGMVNNGG